jgi:hypothetical protein
MRLSILLAVLIGHLVLSACASTAPVTESTPMNNARGDAPRVVHDIDASMQQARVHLATLRRGSSIPEYHIAQLHRHLTLADRSLEHLGTDEEELQELRTRWHVERVRTRFALLRQHPHRMCLYLEGIEALLRQASLSPQDVFEGEDLAKLKNANC